MVEKITEQLERLKEMPLPYQVTFFLTIIIAIITFSQVAIISPLEAETANVMVQKQAVEKKVNLLESFDEQHPDHTAYLKEVDFQVAQVNDQMPNDPIMGNFLLMLDQTAKNTGVTLLSVTPGAVVNGPNFREYPIEVTVRAKYLATLSFMDQCQSLPRFNLIKAVVVQAKQDVLECKIPLSIFVYGTPPAPPKK